jgi:hypothetical protein
MYKGNIMYKENILGPTDGCMNCYLFINERLQT